MDQTYFRKGFGLKKDIQGTLTSDYASGVVDAFLTMARLPLSANMLFVNVMATKMPFVGRG